MHIYKHYSNGHPLERRLWSLIARYWRLQEHDGRVLLRLLLTSPCTRAQEMRHQLAMVEVSIGTVQGRREVDTQHIFQRVVTPQFVMDLLQDFQSSGSLSRVQRQRMEACVLETVSALGAWRPIEDVLL